MNGCRGGHSLFPFDDFSHLNLISACNFNLFSNFSSVFFHSCFRPSDHLFVVDFFDHFGSSSSFFLIPRVVIRRCFILDAMFFSFNTLQHYLDSAIHITGFSFFVFIETLFSGPLNNRIFVANLDYKVGEKKLEEIFRLAGKVLRVRLYTDANGASKGHGTVEFEHPVEAIQAISMFRNQNLYARPMSIRMDKYECEEMPEVLPNVLPSGLESVGKGLGIGGQPLNVSKSLLNGAIGAPSIAPVPNAQTLGPGGQPITNAAAAANVANNPFGAAGVPSYGQITGLGAAVSGSGVQSAIGQPLVGSVVGQVSQSMASSMGQMGMPGLGQQANMNAQLGAGNQNLNQLSNSAQNVLASAASYSGNPMGQSLAAAMQQQSSGLYGTGYEREFREDKFRSGGVGTIVPNVGIGGLGGNSSIGGGGQLVDTVLVRNLPLNFTWQNLRDRFNEIGDVRFAELKGRGMAVVRFSADRDAQRAVELMNGMRIDNRPIDVSLYY